MTTDHEHYQELTALSSGGFLTDQESNELLEHLKTCPDCVRTHEELKQLVRSELPLTEDSFREFLQIQTTKTNSGIRQRFLERAQREGIVFSPEVQKPPARFPKRFGTVLAATAGLAAAVLLAFYGGGLYRRVTGSGNGGTQFAQLQQQNSTLNDTIAQLNRTLEAQQHELQSLRTQLGTANQTAANLRQENEQAQGEIQRSSSQIVQLPEELQNRDKQLEDARNEIQRINQLHADDSASITAQQVRIAALSDQLRIASATLDLERQLTAAGKDIRELLTARQLHVIDVRDTDANGKPSKAFGRIFVTEGKSLTFYAFDLNQDRVMNASHRFEVWGAQQAQGGPAHSLGFFYVDDKTQSRWALKVTDPQLVKEVDSVFVTVEPATGAPKPSGQAILYASLGQPNHP
ncbi:MAG TPA: hypothetical protein VMH89_06575 [Candidatus Acidoferrum sp.]|nr:hypothetical protein [Candidatus Acidoferrum sp.]